MSSWKTQEKDFQFTKYYNNNTPPPRSTHTHTYSAHQPALHTTHQRTHSNTLSITCNTWHMSYGLTLCSFPWLTAANIIYNNKIISSKIDFEGCLKLSKTKAIKLQYIMFLYKRLFCWENFHYCFPLLLIFLTINSYHRMDVQCTPTSSFWTISGLLNLLVFPSTYPTKT